MEPLIKKTTILMALLLLTATTGCRHFDAATARRDHTAAFTQSLQDMQDNILQRPLTLVDCIAIAMTNNYTARQADLDLALQKIAKNIAFTAFLPNLGVSADYQSHHKAPSPMSERRYGQATLEANMPIFMPSAWFLYAATRHGHAAAGLAAHYVRQQVALEVTHGFYQVLVLQESVVAVATQLAAAREAASRFEGLAREGFVTAWERDQAALQAALRQIELETTQRQLQVARNDLLVTLGLAPQANSLASALQLVTPELTATPVLLDNAALVLHALAMHPALAIADRRVVMQEHAVRQAFAAFLPVLNLSAAATWTGNDLATHAANWFTAFGGTWQLFSGFANSARYKAAKVERRRSELEREATFLNIMAQVVAARAAADDAKALGRIKVVAYQVAAAKYADYDARSREGLIPLNEALDARAAMDLAQMELVKSRYQEQIALAGLDLAMGSILNDDPLCDSNSKFIKEPQKP